MNELDAVVDPADKLVHQLFQSHIAVSPAVFRLLLARPDVVKAILRYKISEQDRAAMTVLAKKIGRTLLWKGPRSHYGHTELTEIL